MRTTTKRRAGQLALVTVAAPVAAWALEQAARRAEAGDQDLLDQPAAAPGRRLRAALWSRAAGRPAQAAAGYHRHLETAIAATRPASWLPGRRSARARRRRPRPGAPPGPRPDAAAPAAAAPPGPRAPAATARGAPPTSAVARDHQRGEARAPPRPPDRRRAGPAATAAQPTSRPVGPGPHPTRAATTNQVAHHANSSAKKPTAAAAGPGSRLRLLPRPGQTAAQSGAPAPSAYREAILGADDWFT